ncbi:MAG TPA: hypothetical protein VLI06_11725 [Solimonas sp.]|nr:hypothetical protein [Solimonas sp.]
MIRPAAGLLLALAAAACSRPAPAPAPAARYDPLAAATAAASQRVGNIEAGIPPQCYTRTGAGSNPCWICHTTANGANRADDWELQRRYDFSASARRNHWSNLFVDRRAAIAAIGDAEILGWIRQDNYAPLREAMQRVPEFRGWKPDLDYARGFDEQGFALDGSGWRAFRYKPFPGSFWPTNGATDTVMIRLPSAFRSDAGGQPSRAVYQANLAILEAAIGVPDSVGDAALRRRVEPLDETAVQLDLDGDRRLGAGITELRGLPAHYAGAAAGIAVRRWAYPADTEFLHPVHYVDPDAPELRATRLKELRYARKETGIDAESVRLHYAEEAREQEIGGRPHYSGNAFTGQGNDFGWLLQGWIEDAQGRLRLQTREEQLYCMGCHTGIGVTVDQSFSLPRKLPGAEGWGLQRIAGQRDVPQAGSREPEYRRYLQRVGGGDEFRANDEMLARWFRNGRPDRMRIDAALASEQGLLALIAPSRERALLLDKAYLTLVREQSYALGRDALPAPAVNVHEQLENNDTALKASGKVYRDGRIWLDWE